MWPGENKNKRRIILIKIRPSIYHARTHATDASADRASRPDGAAVHKLSAIWNEDWYSAERIISLTCNAIMLRERASEPSTTAFMAGMHIYDAYRLSLKGRKKNYWRPPCPGHFRPCMHASRRSRVVVATRRSCTTIPISKRAKPRHAWICFVRRSGRERTATASFRIAAI